MDFMGVISGYGYLSSLDDLLPLPDISIFIGGVIGFLLKNLDLLFSEETFDRFLECM